jgi:hypothetical protein
MVGCSRSGTDILADLFSRHEEVVNWSEAAQIFDLDYYDPSIDHYKDGSHIKWADSVRIKIVFGLYGRVCGKKRLLNKHPQNSFRIEYLKNLFPDAKFIHVIREGRAVTHSNYEKARREAFRRLYPFGNFPKPIRWREYLSLPSLSQYACQWRDLVEHVREMGGSALSPDEYLEVRYEDLCADVHAVLGKIDAFCGLDQDQRHYDHIPPTLSSQDFKWKAEFDEGQIYEIESLIAGCLMELGYVGEKIDELECAPLCRNFRPDYYHKGMSLDQPTDQKRDR